MPLPKLTPLQSRFAVSFAASALLLLIYLSFNKPHFAYAVELDSRIPPDHNHPIILLEDPLTDSDEGEHHNLMQRASPGVLALANNAPQNLNIEPGATQNWILPKKVVLGPHGQVGKGFPGYTPSSEEDSVEFAQDGGNLVYITVSTCLQPGALDGNDGEPPQLQVAISTSQSNQLPGPANFAENRYNSAMVGGYSMTFFETEDDVFIGVTAPNTTKFNGIWNYQIAASIDAPYQSIVNDTNLFFIDADRASALLITNATTNASPGNEIYNEWMDITPPWGMFAHSENDKSILAVRNSYCGLANLAQIAANISGFQNLNAVSMTNRGVDKKPKEQFYLTSLNASSSYYGFLAQQGNSTASGAAVIGGGGTVWSYTRFNTKSTSNCALLYNLSFCNEVAYAVPTNPEKYPDAAGILDLAALYDSNAAAYYKYFNYSLQQIPCNTTSTAQYSLARNCDDCAHAYKQWLCAVTIPRCEDYTNDAPYLKPRNVAQPFPNGTVLFPHHERPQTQSAQLLLDTLATNSSRNPIIDQDIRPGPYKEVLPCVDLCYDLVQSCPASLGFGCPLPGKGLEDSYGMRNQSGFITCSYLGAAYFLSAAGRGVEVVRLGWMVWGLVTLIGVGVMW